MVQAEQAVLFSESGRLKADLCFLGIRFMSRRYCRLIPRRTDAF